MHHVTGNLLPRTPYPGGAPANVAAALAKLNVKVAFISALGKDDLAVQMMDLLAGVQCSTTTLSLLLVQLLGMSPHQVTLLS